jgi:hypothetical protein
MYGARRLPTFERVLGELLFKQITFRIASCEGGGERLEIRRNRAAASF